jgi:hypothetical protein
MASPATYAAGVALSICISSANSFGMGLQKRAHRRLLALPKAARPSPSADPGWRAGLAFLALGAVGSLGNYALLGQARASAMAGLTIVTNAAMARFMLGERLTATDAVVAAFVMAGIATSVTFGAGATGSTPLATLDALLAVLNRDATVAVAAPLTVLLALSCEAGARWLKRRREAAAEAADGVAVAGGAAALLAPAKSVPLLAAPLLPAPPRQPADGGGGGGGGLDLALRRFECFLRALLCGCFSGLTGFCAKAVTCCVTSMIAERSADDLQRVEFWAFLIIFPVSMVLQVRAMSEALRDFDAMVMVPMYQSCIVIIGVTWGWLYYNESAGLSSLSRGLFVLGCSLTLCGLAILATRPDSAPPPPEATDSTPLLLDEAAAAAAAAAAPGQARGTHSSALAVVALVGTAGAGPTGSGTSSARRGGGSSSEVRSRAESVLIAAVDVIDTLAPAPLARFVHGGQ